jgi:hypothetical protein
MKCLACGSILETIEYQARSADEAQRSVTTCPKCPLNATKLDIWSDPRPSHIHLKRSIAKTTNQVKFKPKSIVTKYLVSGKTSLSWDPSMKEATCSNAIDNNGYLFRQYTTGPFINMCFHELKESSLGPNVKMTTIHTTGLTMDRADSYTYFTYKHVEENEKLLLISYDKISVWIVVMLEVDTSDKLQETLELMYTKYIKLEFLNDHIPRTQLDSMANLSARASDAASVPKDQYLFSTKADGERLWLSRIGCIWVFSRRLMKHAIVGWHVDINLRDISNGKYSPVLDVEMMIGHKAILIDVLMLSDGSFAPQNRTIEWIYEQFDNLCFDFKYLDSIHKRSLRKTYELAKTDCSTVNYPTDGIVALPIVGIDMIKLKSIKSIELMLVSDGILQSAEGIPILQIKDYKSYEIDAIYEVGISIKGTDYTIHHLFRRPDKPKANGIDAIRSIIESAFIRLPDNATRMALWRWSNEVRAEVYSRARAMLPGKRIIMDIGTGDGQSSDNHMKSSGCSFILVEPDERKCESMRRRLGIKSYEKDPRILIRLLSSLKTGRMTYCIMNCTIQSILDDDAVSSMILPELKCAVACFSAQFVVNYISRFTSASIPFLGTCYLYDGIGIGESIINTGGISMTRVDDDRAVVTWGRDQPYFEPCIESDDFPAGVILTNASRIVEFPSQTGITGTGGLLVSLKIVMGR